MIVLNRPDPELAELVNLFFMCKEFHQLPSPGSMLDQPWKLYTVFEMIQMAVYEKEKKDQDKQEKEARRTNARKR